MREVADGVFEISFGYVNAHLVVVDNGVVLIDTGLPNKSAKIDAALRDARRSVGDITTIMLTHRHPDHTGNLADVRRRSGARVVAHALDTPFITGAATAPVRGIMRVGSLLMKTPEPAEVDEALTGDGVTPVPGMSVLHTPGHTAGHVSYLLDRSGGVLFVGDAAGGGGRGKVRHTPRIITEDRAAGVASVKRLAELSFDIAVFGHGKAVTGRAVERFRRLAGS